MSNLSNIFIGFLAHEKAYGYVSKPSPFTGIDMVMYATDLQYPDIVHYHSKTDLISKYLIEEELWRIAYQNTIDDTNIVSYMGMAVITNKNKFLGASCVLNTDALKECMSAYGTNKIALIPSSIHEFILFPYDDEVDLAAFSCMVKEINRDASIVKPYDCLADRIYTLNLSKVQSITSEFKC